MTSISSSPPSNRTSPFRALGETNVKIFLTGFGLSGVGTWAQTTALVLLVQDLGGSGFELGLTTAFQFLPLLLLGLWAGSLADRVNRFRLTVLLQGLMGIQAIILGLLVMTGLDSLPALFSLTFVLGVLFAVDNPTRRTLLTELVDDHDLASVTSLSTSTVTGARIIGPALGAVGYSLVGPGSVFMANGLTYLFMLAAMRMLDRSKFRSIEIGDKSSTPIRDGLNAVWSSQILRTAVATFAIVSTFGFNSLVSLPLLVDQQLGRNPEFLGVLLSVMSAGNVAGSLLVARQVTVRASGVFIGAGLISVTSLVSAWSSNTALTVAAVFWLGLAGTVFVNSTTVLVQQRSDPKMRSRVLALTAVLFLGSTPIGGPITGMVGDAFGGTWSMAYGGLISGAAALGGVATVLWHRRTVTPSE